MHHFTKHLIVLIFLLTIGSQSALSATITYRQIWDPAAQPLVQGIMTTTARWDDSAITGIGNEFVILDSFTVLREINNIGQSFERALLPDETALPPSQGGPNTMGAFYQNGVLQVIGNITGSGNGFVSLSFDGIDPTGTGVGFRQSGPSYQLLYALPISGLWRYNLSSSEIISVINPIPLPGAGFLFISSIALMGITRRSKIVS